LNADFQTVPYTIRATEFSPTIIPLESGIAFTNTIPVTSSLDYYRFDVATNAYAAYFEIEVPGTNLTLLVRKDLPLPATNRFDYTTTVDVGAGQQSAAIVVMTNTLPMPLSPGAWYLAVANSNAVPVTYQIKATQLISNLITLASGIRYSNTVAAGNGIDLTDFYQFTVSTNAVQAQFETLGANGNVDLLVRKGPSLDFPFVPDYSSTQPSTNNEQIVVTARSVPVPLSPGIWYLGVRNRTAQPVFYQVVATEFFGMPSTNIIQATITGSSDIVCITWNSEVGTNYVVEGLTNLTDSTWTVVPPTITATETTTSFCLSLPNPLHYFRVRLDTAPVQPTNSPIDLRLFFTTNAICLSWNSQIGTNYYVQGKAELNSPAWTTLTTTITATATNTTN